MWTAKLYISDHLKTKNLIALNLATNLARYVTDLQVISTSLDNHCRLIVCVCVCVCACV